MSLKRASDYEEALGTGSVRIFRGHPRYCPIEYVHAAHRFDYAHLDSKDLEVTGSYLCHGYPFEFAQRPVATPALDRLDYERDRIHGSGSKVTYPDRQIPGEITALVDVVHELHERIRALEARR